MPDQTNLPVPAAIAEEIADKWHEVDIAMREALATLRAAARSVADARAAAEYLHALTGDKVAAAALCEEIRNASRNMDTCIEFATEFTAAVALLTAREREKLAAPTNTKET